MRVHFETAKNLYLYAWFVYRFYPVSEQHALATLEFALRERLAPLFPQFCGDTVEHPPGLRRLFEKARKEKLISNAGLRATKRLALNRARLRAINDCVRDMEARGVREAAFNEAAALPLAEDYRHDVLATFAETLPRVRNKHAHGGAMLHPSVLDTFEIVTDLVNHLYPADSLAQE